MDKANFCKKLQDLVAYETCLDIRGKLKDLGPDGKLNHRRSTLMILLQFSIEGLEATKNKTINFRDFKKIDLKEYKDATKALYGVYGDFQINPW